MKTIGLVLHPSNLKAAEAAASIRDHGSQRGLNVVVAEGESADLDAVVALGGDGTLLRGAQIAWKLDVPIVGANLGNLGFLSTVAPDEVEQMVKQLMDDVFRVEERMVLEARGRLGESELFRVMALNEVVLERPIEARVVDIKVRVDEETVAVYTADGFIVSTPTGSTAYSLSAGGPVVEPEVEAMILTSICAHSPLWRSIVVNPQRTVTLETPDDRVAVTADGQLISRLEPGSTITVVRHPRPLKLLAAYEAHFFDKLRTRFHVDPPTD